MSEKRSQSDFYVTKKAAHCAATQFIPPLSCRYALLRSGGILADYWIKLHVDHIIPVSKGGRTELSNLQTLCNICNLGKSNKEESPGKQPGLSSFIQTTGAEENEI